MRTHRWRGVEFAVRPYKEFKDTWLLAGVDEITQLLEDSLIAIAAISASRYVGGIRCAPAGHAWKPLP